MNFLRHYQKNLHRLFLNLISCCLSYTLWASFSQFSSVSITKEVPILLYERKDNICYTSNIEQVIVKIQGSRSALRQSDITQLAVHINAEELNTGKNIITPTDQHLFLPPAIQLVHCKPHYITIMVKTI